MKEPHTDDTDLRKLFALVDGIDVAMLTTHAADGSLVSRPLKTLKLDASGELVFFTGANSHKIDELTADRGVNVAYADHEHGRYVSVRGRARLDRNQEMIDELWSAPQKIFFPEGKDDPNLMVLHIDIRDAMYWESAGNFLERTLDFAQGMMSKDPADLGEQGHLEPNGQTTR